MTLTLENSATSPAIFEPLVTRAEDGPWVELGDHRGRVLVSSRNNAEAFGLAHTIADFNGGVPPHIHDREDETFYIMKGRVEFGVGGETIVANAGDTVFAPRGIAHTWRCTSEAGAEFLILFTPGDNFESFIMEMAQQGIVPSDEASIEKLVALSEQYGIHMLPPA
jgi:quercetin dioxygenase-like cupin family protein